MPWRPAASASPTISSIEKCATQRNLSDRGKQQARKIGALIAARAAPVERVLTSRYCRARETARLAFGDSRRLCAAGSADAEPTAGKAADRGYPCRKSGDYSGSGNLMLVTHLETIQALTGEPRARGRGGHRSARRAKSCTFWRA